MTTMVAVDVGAQSGRVALGRLDGERLTVSEVHRFQNVPVALSTVLRWNAPALFDEILAGVDAAAQQAPEIASVGVDTWGVDFGLVDRSGTLLEDPVHHRDPRTEGAMERAFERVPARELYERTGIQLMPFNTVFQLFVMAERGSRALEAAEHLLLMPDLFHHWLCGAAVCEWTNATTTQCLDVRTGGWATDLLDRLGIPARPFPDVVPPATVLGPLRRRPAQSPSLRDTAVVAPATHDTGSAVAAVPFRHRDAAYISAGSWSLVGLELAAPLLGETTFASNLTNEGGVEGRSRLLRNVNGLWLLGECRRSWAEGGRRWGFEELVRMAGEAPALRSLVDPNDARFLEPGDIPRRIVEFCVETGQEPPSDPPAVIRCLLESLALKHREAIRLLGRATGTTPPEVHIVGGGARNALLCQWTADATGLPVLAGPVEATEIGNLLVQAMALGALASLDDARAVVRASFQPDVYEPADPAAWREAAERFGLLASRPAAEVGA